MKKISFYLASILILVASCSKEDILEPIPYQISEELIINEASGIRLQNYNVQEEVNINIKLPETGTYRIKLVDISNTTISQEKVDGVKGDNLLKIYVKALPASSYTVLVTDEKDALIGRDLFSKI